MNTVGMDAIMDRVRTSKPGNEAPADLRDACRQFEGLLLGMVLKDSLRDVFSESGEEGVAGMETFKDFCIEQVSATLAETGTLGIADQLLGQLTPPPRPTTNLEF